MMKPFVFREYDIRGVVNKDYDEAFAEELGRAFVTYLRRKSGVKFPRVSLGQDARLSSPALVAALTRGLRTSGATVFQLGLITTPVSYFSTFTLDIHGAIMVTGSHNPPEYNGFKISAGKGTLFGLEIQALRKIIETRDFEGSSESMIGGDLGSEEHVDILSQYVAHHQKEFRNLKKIPLVLDCGNGAAGCVARRLYNSVGLDPEILFEEPNGLFPNHHPDPTIEENVHDLQKSVVNTSSTVGIGFDGDADRIGVVTSKGRLLLGDELMVLISRSILHSRPNSTIIGDVKCSDRLYADIQNHGGRGLMWKTGHSLIKQKIKEEGSPFGGELSGHIFFADRNFGYDDALYAGIRVVEILSESGLTIDELLEDLPHSYNTPEIRIDTTEEKKASIVEYLRNKYSKPSPEYKINLIDGIRISYSDGWALVRASNTQPVLVLRFESSTQRGLDRIRSEIENSVNSLL